MPSLILRNGALEKRLLDYVLACVNRHESWWGERVPGTVYTRQEQIREWRERYRSRRSVAQLFSDAKNEPFVRASNIGIGVEQIFGERLLATTLANTVDLEPSVQAFDEATGRVDDTLTSFHDQYLRHELSARNIYESVHREVFTVGTCFTKWTWGSLWKQTEVPYWVWSDPQTKQPAQRMNPQTGAPELMPADPQTPKEATPTNALGQPLVPIKLSSVDVKLIKQGPQISVRQLESIGVPMGALQQDPNEWDYVYDRYNVSPWWFLGREGDPFEGQFQNIDKLWKHLAIDPNNLYLKPDGKLLDPVDLIEWHGKFPMASDGKPVEVIALIANKPKLMLAWRLSPFSRRPFFNHLVWGRTTSPYGVGVPESLWGVRAGIDVLFNQDFDAGNLYNHPPLLLSTLAQAEDEDYETVGPGTVWTMQDINGVKFLAPPVSQRNPLELLNFLMGMAQRLWGVTDFVLNAPTQSLSPNVKTATGAMIVQSEGNIKFGHLTKRLESTRSKELQLDHEMFGAMLSEPKRVEVDGKVGMVGREFFRDGIVMRAVGDGIQTNPAIRQQVDMALYQLFVESKNPYILDLETLYDVTKKMIQDYGWKVDIKPAQILQQLQLLQQVASTPIGQQKIGEAIQILQAQMAQQQAMQAGNGGVGVRPGVMPGGMAG